MMVPVAGLGSPNNGASCRGARRAMVGALSMGPGGGRPGPTSCQRLSADLAVGVRAVLEAGAADEEAVVVEQVTHGRLELPEGFSVPGGREGGPTAFSLHPVWATRTSARRPKWAEPSCAYTCRTGSKGHDVSAGISSQVISPWYANAVDRSPRTLAGRWG